jgi:hypothetical protein
MNNLQERIAAVLLRWPWEPGKQPHAWDIQGQLRRQGGEMGLEPVVAALEALAARQAIRVGPQTPAGNIIILEVFPTRLQEILP